MSPECIWDENIQFRLELKKKIEDETLEIVREK